jgi:hypothetical protein
MKATYQTCGLPDYDGNPLIAALPPILSTEEAAEALTHQVAYDNKARKLPAHIRQHALLPILQFFQPLSHHLELEGKVSRMLRFGYVGRNPTHRGFFKENHTKAKQICAQTKTPSTCTNSTILGTSGTGKTTGVNRILSLYPQVIEHINFQGQPFPHTQLVWLKLECPFDGSIKAICRNFFESVDQTLGTDYTTLHGVRRLTADEMLPKMALVAGLHTLGTLVIDEIQHLSTAKSGGASKMLNFFVELTNRMDMPILLIGTTKAISIISQEFRSARRGSGQGEMVWRPMAQDEEWTLFLESLWVYQYTQHTSPLTEELSATLFNESQGITDFAVKLYMLAQIRAITTGVEQVTPTIIKSVARDSLQTAQPFLQALRSGDYTHLPNFEDIIQPLDYAKLAEKELERKVKVPSPTKKPERTPEPKRERKDPQGGLLDTFKARGKDCGYEALKEADFVAPKNEFLAA